MHFGHVEKIGERVLIIGVGNTAMDCCRTSRRLGGKDIKVIARRSRKYFKASPWELEDAEEELVEIVENHAPKRFIVENGKLVGMELEHLRWFEENGKQRSEVIDTVMLPCDDVMLAIGQDNAFPWIERDIGIKFDSRTCPSSIAATMQSHARRRVLRRRRGVGPGEHHLGRGARAPGGDLDPQPLPGSAAQRAPAVRDESRERQGRHALVELQQRLQSPAARSKMQHAELAERFANLSTEVELGFTAEQTAAEVERCLNCDIQTHFTANLCIECDACVDVCPVNCLTITHDGSDEADLRTRLMAPATNVEAGHLCLRRAAADEAHHGEGRGRVPALRAVRRALSDRGVGHAAVRPPDSVRGDSIRDRDSD